MTPEQFVVVIGDIESSQNTEAFGDAGRAVGRYQVHPDWLWEHAEQCALAPSLGETWDSFITRVLAAFARLHWGFFAPVEVAMWFHIGHALSAQDSQWDKSYEAKFDAAATKRGFLPA